MYGFAKRSQKIGRDVVDCRGKAQMEGGSVELYPGQMEDGRWEMEATTKGLHRKG
jgi:hypothetical protein